MRWLLTSIGAVAVMLGANSEAVPFTGSHALLRPGFSASAGHPLVAPRWTSFRSYGGVPSQEAALRSLRGGGFSWGSPEPPTTSRRGRGSNHLNSNPSGGSGGGGGGDNGHGNGSDVLGMFGNAMSAAWGGGSSSNNDDNSIRDRKRVETKGPPDLSQQRPPPSVPEASNDVGGGLSRYASVNRDRVTTVGPPDAASIGGRASGHERGSRQERRRSSGVGRFFAAGAQQTPSDFSTTWAGGGGAIEDGAAEPYRARGRTAGSGSRRDDGEGSAPWRTAQGNRRGLMAVHYLIISCFALFSLDTILGVDSLFSLSLDHNRPKWWQVATSVLLHGDQHHLMGNMFNLLVFGKMAEEDMGSFGMLSSFFTCGVVSCIVSLLIMPRNTYSCGASGAIFGLYSVCILGKMFNTGWNSQSEGGLRKLVEALVFGWFVVESVRSELQMVAGGGMMGVDHAAHFGGVFAGAMFILIMRKSIRKS